MKKLIVLLLSVVMVFSILAGCRRQTNGEPGDPTVNNTTTPTVPTMTSPITRPSTEPTTDTTVPDSTENTTTLPGESSTNSDARYRDRMIPHR